MPAFPIADSPMVRVIRLMAQVCGAAVLRYFLMLGCSSGTCTNEFAGEIVCILPYLSQSPGVLWPPSRFPALSCCNQGNCRPLWGATMAINNERRMLSKLSPLALLAVREQFRRGQDGNTYTRHLPTIETTCLLHTTERWDYGTMEKEGHKGWKHKGNITGQNTQNLTGLHISGKPN